MRSCDVVIIGAGPAGSSAAIMLARLGYSVALLDKEQFPREKLCGDFINPSNWPILRALGVEKEILSRARQRVTGFRITTVAGDEAECPLPLTSTEPFGLGLSRRSLDHILVEKAQGESVIVLQSCRIQNLEREETGWWIGFTAGRSRGHHSCATLRGRVLPIHFGLESVPDIGWRASGQVNRPVRQPVCFAHPPSQRRRVR